MSEYKRLTEKRETPLTMSMWGGTSKELRIYNRLADLEDKMDSGLLVELPKKCYQVIWLLGWEIIEYDVISVKYDYLDDLIEEIVAVRGNSTTYFNRSLEKHYRKIGEDVFFTKAEAEARLKELRDETN